MTPVHRDPHCPGSFEMPLQWAKLHPSNWRRNPLPAAEDAPSISIHWDSFFLFLFTRKANELLPAVRAQPTVLPERWAEQQGVGVSARCPPRWGQADGSSYGGTDSAKRLSTHLSFSMLGAVPQPTKHLSMGSKGDSGKGLKLSMIWWTWPWCCHSGNFHLPRLLFSGLFLIKTSFKKENKYLLSLMLCF